MFFGLGRSFWFGGCYGFEMADKAFESRVTGGGGGGSGGFDGCTDEIA